MIQKYGAALISIALVAFAFLKTALADELDAAEVAQLVALVAGAVIVYFVPLLSGPWAGGLKTGSAIVAAAATALVPFLLNGGLTPEQWTIVALAVLNALGVEVGVAYRKAEIVASAPPTDREGAAAING
jgi:hypothetical protein